MLITPDKARDDPTGGAKTMLNKRPATGDQRVPA
jgi:hypothetical protein